MANLKRQYQDSTNKQRPIQINNWGNFLGYRIGHLYEDGEQCDLTFRFPSEDVKAHSIVFHACSPSFIELVGVKSSGNKVLKMPSQMSPAGLKAILHFLYYGVLRTPYSAFELMETAHLLKLQILERLIQATVDGSAAAGMREHAERSQKHRSKLDSGTGGRSDAVRNRGRRVPTPLSDDLDVEMPVLEPAISLSEDDESEMTCSDDSATPRPDDMPHDAVGDQPGRDRCPSQIANMPDNRKPLVLQTEQSRMKCRETVLVPNEVEENGPVGDMERKVQQAVSDVATIRKSDASCSDKAGPEVGEAHVSDESAAVMCKSSPSADADPCEAKSSDGPSTAAVVIPEVTLSLTVDCSNPAEMVQKLISTHPTLLTPGGKIKIRISTAELAIQSAQRFYISTELSVANKGGSSACSKPRHGRLQQPSKPKSCVCRVCSRRVSDDCHLDLHLLTDHDVLPRRDRQLFVCDQCSLVVPRLAALNQHRVERHQLPKQYRCRLCNCTFAQRRRLELHLQKECAARRRGGDGAVSADRLSCADCGLVSALSWVIDHHRCGVRQALDVFLPVSVVPTMCADGELRFMSVIRQPRDTRLLEVASFSAMPEEEEVSVSVSSGEEAQQDASYDVAEEDLGVRRPYVGADHNTDVGEIGSGEIIKETSECSSKSSPSDTASKKSVDVYDFFSDDGEETMSPRSGRSSTDVSYSPTFSSNVNTFSASPSISNTCSVAALSSSRPRSSVALTLPGRALIDLPSIRTVGSRLSTDSLSPTTVLPSSGDVPSAATVLPSSGDVPSATRVLPFSGDVSSAARVLPSSGDVPSAATVLPSSGDVSSAATVLPSSGDVPRKVVDGSCLVRRSVGASEQTPAPTFSAVDDSQDRVVDNLLLEWDG